MSTQVIRSSLESRLSAWAVNHSVQVAWQNTAFTKPTSGPYVEPFVIPNAVLPRDTEASKSTYLGLFQVNIWVRVGTGMGAAEVLAESLRETFPVVPKVNGVQIDKASIGAPIGDPSGWIATPVIISYRYDS